MTPARRAQAHRTYSLAASRAFESVAWRAPSSERFDDRVANDPPAPVQSVGEAFRDVPAWLHIVGGGVIAALLGALLGGALHI